MRSGSKSPMRARTPFPLWYSKPLGSISWGLVRSTWTPSNSKKSGHSHIIPNRPRFSTRTLSKRQWKPSSLE